MSDPIQEPKAPMECASEASQEEEIIFTEAREATLGSGMKIRRALPVIKRRMIGPWCFLDHFGPASFQERDEGMWVGPHPHIGLQTVTWMIEGEVLHRDSIGSEQLIERGQLNIMTSGRGISHTEESPTANSGILHGVQLWVALPDAVRHADPDFEHHPELPIFEKDEQKLTLFAGQAFKERSPATVYSPMVGMELLYAAAGDFEVALDEGFEHGLILVEGEASVQGHPLELGKLAYLAPGYSTLKVKAQGPARLVLVGGAPFQEQILLWWNFVGRTPEEIHKAREAWMHQEPQFGSVAGFDGPRLLAPEWVPGIKAKS